MFINFQHLFQKKKKTQNNNQKSCLLHSSIFPCYVLSHMRVVSLVFVVVVIVGAAVVIFVCLIFLFRDAPTAYGSSQTRGLIRATAAGLPTATAMPDASHICNLHHSSWQRQILNPQSKARDGTHILMDTRWIHLPRREPPCCLFFVSAFPQHLASQGRWSENVFEIKSNGLFSAPL